jgi:hypothetical protein
MSSADVVGDQVVMGNQMALVGMIPKPAYILDQLSFMIDQRVVESDHSARRIPR